MHDSIISQAISLSRCSKWFPNSGFGQCKSLMNAWRASNFQNKSSEVAHPFLRRSIIRQKIEHTRVKRKATPIVLTHARTTKPLRVLYTNTCLEVMRLNYYYVTLSTPTVLFRIPCGSTERSMTP